MATKKMVNQQKARNGVLFVGCLSIMMLSILCEPNLIYGEPQGYFVSMVSPWGKQEIKKVSSDKSAEFQSGFGFTLGYLFLSSKDPGFGWGLVSEVSDTTFTNQIVKAQSTRYNNSDLGQLRETGMSGLAMGNYFFKSESTHTTSVFLGYKTGLYRYKTDAYFTNGNDRSGACAEAVNDNLTDQIKNSCTHVNSEFRQQISSVAYGFESNFHDAFPLRFLFTVLQPLTLSLEDMSYYHGYKYDINILYLF
ncbi:MAG: hypothetical protein A2527_12590 [Candidatus Lambdaproteobacteria bacterium RIFOXYD2_FULL_50_16]|uniref:Uncharacterized protein n=1 Tax=Candidatus Lambdaproteobacteria bacterium RIFOXYD2_FULL_50_16 TaxID=1817772 RepID=A0A1F6GE10_9PROT|nr:MAG: hypothetical protein A2527_12590 [Candidatus Lambdaproteobacteria bacterium RIFOXYD2_FULL_50_16]